MTGVRHALRVSFAALSVIGLVVVLSGQANGAPLAKNSGDYSTAQILNYVKAAATTKTFPSSLDAALANANVDQGTYLAQDVYGLVGSKKVSCNPLGTQSQVPVQSCIWGDSHATKTIVLVGDSHAAQWIAGFDLIGKRLHLKVVLLTKSACGVPDISFYYYSTKGAYPYCKKWHSYVTKEINKIDPAAVIFASDVVYPLNGSGAHITAAQWTAGMVKTLDSITAPGIKKVVLGDEPRLGNPYPGEFGPSCLATHETSVQSCSTPTQIAIRAGLYSADEAGAKQAGASYINVTPWFCSATCTALVHSVIVYADDGHITNDYAEFVSGALQAALERATGIT